MMVCPKCGAQDKIVRVHYRPDPSRADYVGRVVMHGGEGGELRLYCQDCQAILPDDVKLFEHPKKKVS